MRSLTLLRTAPGAAVALTIVATMGVSAYALTNWFNANVTVKQNDSVLTIDLSDCKGSLPPGFGDNTDRRNVRYKVLGIPHISAEQLQGHALAECENNAVTSFYQSNALSRQYSLYPSHIKALNADGTVTLSYFWGGKTNEKVFTLTKGISLYDQSRPSTLQEFKVGDPIVFAVEAPQVEEGIDPLDAVNEVKSIFKTQYNLEKEFGNIKKAYYDENNIMPLEMYNQLNK